MAKVTITLEDSPDGKVKTTVEPNFSTMMKMNQSGAGLTSAHAYALFALRMISEESKRQAPTPILIPRTYRA